MYNKKTTIKMEEDKQKKEVNNINSELLKKFPMPSVIEAMERVQDLIVRSQPKPSVLFQDEMCTVKYFKATKNTKRFNANQKVWITLECANHLYIRFKYRGKGRYVNGVVDKFAKCVGEIKSIEVSKDFANNLGVVMIK